LPEIVEACEAVEVKFTELAAARRTQEDLNRMARALSDMARAIAQGEDAERADQLFHQHVVMAGRNRMLASFYEQIGPEILEARRESLRQPGQPKKSLTQHRRIFAAIEAQDAKRAATAAQSHIASVRRVSLLTWDLEGSDLD
jgi:GntR family transcriptional repressor for pyruvate dehydrogenase complex